MRIYQLRQILPMGWNKLWTENLPLCLTVEVSGDFNKNCLYVVVVKNIICVKLKAERMTNELIKLSSDRHFPDMKKIQSQIMDFIIDVIDAHNTICTVVLQKIKLESRKC